MNYHTVTDEKDGFIWKKLNVFGASYIYPVFLALEICRKSPEERKGDK